MMASTDPAAPSSAPSLSTFQHPDDFFVHTVPSERAEDPSKLVARSLTPAEIERIYEIDRTVEWITKNGHARVALQFPDTMLSDSIRVVESLERRWDGGSTINRASESADDTVDTAVIPRFFILGDTSYGSCCVDEVAAEHCSADSIIHYGRACLSPTVGLPVLWVYTTQQLDTIAVSNAIREAIEQKNGSQQQAVLLMGDLPYTAHIPEIIKHLIHTTTTTTHSETEEKEAEIVVWSTEVVHNPSAPIPNRRIVRSGGKAGQEEQADNTDAEVDLRSCAVFHIGTPPTPLLLSLSSRVGDLYIYNPEAGSSSSTSSSTPSSLEQITRHTSAILARRYGTITSLATAGVWGILVNTLSVREYSTMLSHVRAQLKEAGKKAYTVVVGKVNPAKVANFAEIEGWVVVGCWENSLVDVSSPSPYALSMLSGIGGGGGGAQQQQLDFWRPLITPFELGLALQPDYKRVWTGEWTTDLATVLARPVDLSTDDVDENADGDESDEPPEFDLRTGRYISSTYSRPMNTAIPSIESAAPIDPDSPDLSQTLITTQSPSQQQLQKSNPTTSALSTYSVAGVFSPGARFLHTKREWQGLGSDFGTTGVDSTKGAELEQGIGGIARGYEYLETDMSDRMAKLRVTEGGPAGAIGGGGVDNCDDGGKVCGCGKKADGRVVNPRRV